MTFQSLAETEDDQIITETSRKVRKPMSLFIGRFSQKSLGNKPQITHISQISDVVNPRVPKSRVEPAASVRRCGWILGLVDTDFRHEDYFYDYSRRTLALDRFARINKR
jgi:hypothetical protein